MSFNFAKTKRAAHTLSRHSSNTTYSPFAHFKWGDKTSGDEEAGPSRRGTFPRDPVAHGEERPGSEDDDEIGHGVAHTNTAPAGYGSDQAEGSHQHGSKLPSREGNASEDTSVDHQAEKKEDGTFGMVNRKPKAASLKEKERAEPDDSHKSRAKKEKKDHRLFKRLEPKTPFTFANQIQRTFLSSWINVLLVAAPVGIVLGAIKANDTAIFVVNFIAIIPLAAMLGFATEEIALRVGETLGGLLNATFGNAVELIVAIIALIKNEVVIVQTSLIGSILSNLLLVLGLCFFCGGLRRQEQFFNTTVAQTAASLLALAVAGVIVPTVFDRASETPTSEVAQLSRGTSVILLFVYGAYLFFQLKTHHAVFAEESQKVPKRPSKRSVQKAAMKQGLVGPVGLMAQAHGLAHSDHQRLSKHLNSDPDAEIEDEDAEEEPQLHFFVALAVLAGVTVVIALCAEFLVGSIEYVTTEAHISKEFLGLILLPIVGNAAEHATAVTVAIKDKMDLAIGVAVGSSMQVALFLIPLVVIIGWGMGNDEMSLSFDIFQVAVLFVAVLLVNYLIADGKSHWLEGMLLICLYAIIAVCSWWYPVEENGAGHEAASL